MSGDSEKVLQLAEEICRDYEGTKTERTTLQGVLCLYHTYPPAPALPSHNIQLQIGVEKDLLIINGLLQMKVPESGITEDEVMEISAALNAGPNIMYGRFEMNQSFVHYRLFQFLPNIIAARSVVNGAIRAAKTDILRFFQALALKKVMGGASETAH